MLKGLQAKLYLLGAAVMAVLATWARMKFLKAKADKATIKANLLEATILSERVKKRIIKEQKKKEFTRRDELLKELKKSDEDFKGIDNLTNSNKR